MLFVVMEDVEPQVGCVVVAGHLITVRTFEERRPLGAVDNRPHGFGRGRRVHRLRRDHRRRPVLLRQRVFGGFHFGRLLLLLEPEIVARLKNYNSCWTQSSFPSALAGSTGHG